MRVTDWTLPAGCAPVAARVDAKTCARLALLYMLGSRLLARMLLIDVSFSSTVGSW